MLSPIKAQNNSFQDIESQTIQIGQNTLHQESTKYLKKKNSQLFGLKNWFLEKGKFRFDQWFELMPLVIELKFCEELHLCTFRLQTVKNNEQNIIKALIFTQFKSLRNLSLGMVLFTKQDHNMIRNIEALQFIDAPNMKYLGLQNNLILNISPLKKTAFKRLLIIQLYNNPIHKLIPIHRVDYPRISEFYLAHMNPRSDPYSIHSFLEDVAVYAKFCHFQKYNKKKGAHVISQQKVESKIKQRAQHFCF